MGIGRPVAELKTGVDRADSMALRCMSARDRGTDALQPKSGS